uniref:Secreted protein n=1 Tax=Prymnesium polylepis TaxID=72548 RepID=A0A7S4MLM3_9EUKA|mmetsp:Transcript_32074/g.79320  ORF Transcript_32074/g.79320 Transcript_32074/m.79320 type:complete len:130 (+) Transcript_32074:519-908(+)
MHFPRAHHVPTSPVLLLVQCSPLSATFLCLHDPTTLSLNSSPPVSAARASRFRLLGSWCALLPLFSGPLVSGRVLPPEFLPSLLRVVPFCFLASRFLHLRFLASRFLISGSAILHAMITLRANDLFTHR